MGIDFPNSPSAGDTYTYEGETYRYNGVAFVKVRDRVTTFNGATGAIIGVTSVQGKTGDVTLTDLEITHGVETFNGLSGSIDTTSLTLPVAGISASGGITSNGPSTINGYGFLDSGVVLAPNGVNISLQGDSDIDVKLRSNGISINDNAEAITTTVKGDGDVHLLTVHGSSDKVGIGVQNPQEKLDVNGTIKALGISGPSAITFDNGEVIRNNPDGSIQIIPSDEGGNHYGIEIDSTEWGFGPTITAIEEDGSQVDNAIRFDSDIVLGSDGSGSRVRLTLNSSADRGLQQNIQGDGTIGMGVNGDNGHFAVIRKADLNDGDRSMSTSDKTALGMSNPQFLVYSSDSTNANDYIRLEHDQTDANIYSGTGNINLAPAGGVVGISGGTLEANNFVVDGGKIFQKGNEATTHIDMSSAQDITIKAGDDINLNPDGLSSFVFRNDGTNITVGRIFGGGDGRFISVSDDMTIIDIGDLDTVSTNSKIRLSDDGISLFDEGGTRREVIDTSYRRNTDVATFTIDASSAIATGAKTNSLYRIPYNATLKNFDVKTNATGGLTAAIRIAGADFGNPLTSGITGCSLGIEGLTGSSTVFNQASVTAGNFILLDIFSNNSGASAAQAFLTFESR